jgi:hypothetical protein
LDLRRDHKRRRKKGEREQDTMG